MDAYHASRTVVAKCSGPGRRLIVNYQSPSWVGAAGRVAMRMASRIARGADPLEHEPRRSSWTPMAMSDLLARHEWRVVQDDDLLTLAQRLPMEVRNRRSIASGRVAVAALMRR